MRASVPTTDESQCSGPVKKCEAPSLDIRNLHADDPIDTFLVERFAGALARDDQHDAGDE